MAIISNSRHGTRRKRRVVSVAKPSGCIHPRVQKVGPEHFGVVAVDCAKARSKWMLTDFYGNILIEPTHVEHTRAGLDAFMALVHQARQRHDLRDLVVAIERTGNYHLPIKRAVVAAGLEPRIVHPLASKQCRLPADPGNKTDDTDLAAIQRAAVNGFGLIDPVLDEVHAQLRLLIRHRRDLVRKNATLRNQIHAELDAMLPGLAAAVGDIFERDPARMIARRLGSPAAIRAAGMDGLAALLKAAGVRFQRRALVKILAWADGAHEPAEQVEVHKRILAHLDDERLTRLRAIRALECDLASLLVRTPYALLLSFPGINVVSAAEFAGEMGPIANSPSDNAVTGRAGLFPSRYQSDRVDHAGPLVRRANRSLRRALMMIGENLMRCNDHFLRLAESWRAAGMDRRAMVVRAAKRFSRIAYRMVAGREVYRHPACRERHYILEKLSNFYFEHGVDLEQVVRGLHEAVNWLPPAEYAAEAKRLRAALPPALPASRRGRAAPPNSAGRCTGPRPLSAILPEILLRLGVTMVESSPSGETGPT